MAFKDYSDENPPTRGTAKKIYDILKQHSIKVRDLHYNPNCWGHNPEDGWGTWACEIIVPAPDIGYLECFCGYVDGKVYVQKNKAPYTVAWLAPVERADDRQQAQEAG